MLKQRVLTAIILISIFVLIVLKLPPIWFCTLTAIMVLACAWEWTSLMGITTISARVLYLILMLGALVLALWLKIPNVMLFAGIWWLFGTLLVSLYPKAQNAWGNGSWVRGCMGFFVLIPCWLALNFIRNEFGVYVLLLLFVLIWGADSGAYFVGRKWGKTKLAPYVSPGKSIEGLMGALFITVLIAIAVLLIAHAPYSAWLGVISLCLLTVLFSVLGDLFESMLKRKEGLKDSGKLLPGHGGLLDRIDSLTAAAPIFALGAIWLGR